MFPYRVATDLYVLLFGGNRHLFSSPRVMICVGCVWVFDCAGLVSLGLLHSVYVCMGPCPVHQASSWITRHSKTTRVVATLAPVSRLGLGSSLFFVVG